MATDVIKKIGATHTPTTMDYLTLQAWEDDVLTLYSNNLVAADVRWIGELYNQGSMTAALNIAGETVDSTRYIILRTATGASFKDNAGVRSGALFFNASNGAAIVASVGYDSVIKCSVDYTTFQYLQVKNSSSSNPSGPVTLSNSFIVVDGCILEGEAYAVSAATATSNLPTLKNCLLVTRVSGAKAVNKYVHAYDCTVGNTHASGGGVAWDALYVPVILKNTAVFNHSSIASNGGGGGLSASSDYNCTDLAAPTNWGAHSLASKTFANQFVSTTTDFRAKAAADLENAGTPDATNAPTDISGLTRSASTPTIGAWELSAAAGVTTAQEIPAFVQQLSSQMVGLVIQ